MEAIFQVVGVIAPFLLIMSIGYGYARVYPISLDHANILNLRLFTPALVFSSLSDIGIASSEITTLIAAVLVVIAGGGLISLMAARLLKQPVGPFVACTVFTNTGNMGLPMALLAFSQTGFQLAVIVFVTVNVLHFALGTGLFSRQFRIGKSLLNPNVLACVLALLSNQLQITLPGSVSFTIEMLGNVCVPLMIFSLGVRLANAKLSHWVPGLLASVIGPIGGLIPALICVALIPMSVQLQQSLLLFSVLPPAVINLLMAERYKTNADETAAMVFIGNLSSMLVIPLLLLTLRYVYGS